MRYANGRCVVRRGTRRLDFTAFLRLGFAFGLAREANERSELANEVRERMAVRFLEYIFCHTKNSCKRLRCKNKNEEKMTRRANVVSQRELEDILCSGRTRSGPFG